jgi:hypothetical protein
MGKTRNAHEILAKTPGGRTHLQDGNKDRMVHIINVLGLDRTESLKMKLSIGLLYIQTRTVINDYGKSVE